MRIAFAVILVVLIALGAAELRRWRTPELADALLPAQKRRRIGIFVALSLVDALIIAGTFLPQGHLSRWLAVRELEYWAAVMLVFLVSLVALFVEAAATRRREALRAATGERDAAYKEMVESVARAEQQAVERRERPKRNGHA